MSSYVTPLFDRVQPLLSRIDRTQTIIAASTIFIGLPFIRHVRTDYQRWLSLGRGGAPHSFLGYLLTAYLGAYGDWDVHTTVRYVREGEASELERTSFFDGPVPIRQGPAPVISKWALPVRQLSAMAPADVKQKLFSTIQSLASTLSAVTMSTSTFEGGTHEHNALHLTAAALSTSVHQTRRFVTRGPTELYHVHPSDGSAHAIVSAADAKMLVEAGWSERHPLSGVTKFGFPSNYVHVYAPRTEEEIRVHEMAARAAVGYALGRKV